MSEDAMRSYYRTPEMQLHFRRLIKQNGFDTMSELRVKTLLGRKWKTCLELIGAFINEYKYVTTRDYITELNISVTSENLVDIFESSRNVSNVIKMTKKIGLIICTDVSYTFGQKDQTKNRSRKYIWNKAVQDVVLRMIEHEKINVRKPNSSPTLTSYDHVTELASALLASKSAPKFSSKLRLACSTRSVTSSRIGNALDSIIIRALELRYPQLLYYQRRCEEMAERFGLDMTQRLTFEPSIHRSPSKKYVTKIGIRAYSPVCALEKDERDEYLRHTFEEPFVEYDVKSSIYRVTKLLNYGIWEDDGVDLYTQMYPRQEKLTPEERAAFKQLAMRLYFDYPNKVYLHTLPVWEGYNEADVKADLKEIRQSMLNVTGPFYDSEIFFHESCIYIDVAYALRLRCASVVQVYDCFYVMAPTLSGAGQESLRDPGVVTREEIADVVKTCALTYYNTWVKPNGPDSDVTLNKGE